MIDVGEDGTLRTEVPELAQEVGKRLVGGLLRLARSYVPTRDNAEGKKEHVDVPILGGAIYIGTDHSPYAAVIRTKLVELCKKKSPLRAAVEQMGDRYSASLNYGTASPWLKTHEKNIVRAEIGPGGIILSVVPGVVELRLSATDSGEAYARGVADMISRRVLEENLESGPHPLPGEAPEGAMVLVVSEGGARYERIVDLESPDFQMRFKPGLLPGSDCLVSMYADPLGGKIVRVTTDEATVHVDQFLRVLDLRAGE